MKKVILFLLSIFLINLKSFFVFAPECGVAISPFSNNWIIPSSKTIGEKNTVKIPYIDLSSSEQGSRTDLYKAMLRYYKKNNLTIVLVITRESYPNLLKNIDGFESRFKYVSQEFNKYVDFYQIWDKSPDDENSEFYISPDNLNRILSIVKKYTDKPIVLGDLHEVSFVQQINQNKYDILGLRGFDVNIGAEPFKKENIENILDTVSDFTQFSKPIWITSLGTKVYSYQIPLFIASKTNEALKEQIQKVIWETFDQRSSPYCCIVDTSFEIPNISNFYQTYKQYCLPDEYQNFEYIKVSDLPTSDEEEIINIAPIETSSKIKPFIYPINISDSSYDGILQELVINQGYEAVCSGKTKMWLAQIDLLEGEDEEIEIIPGIQHLDASSFDAKIPLFYNKDKGFSELKTNSSIEGFFGADPINKQDITKESGAIYSITTDLMQCKRKINILETAKKMCEVLQNPSECPLIRPISETPYFLYNTDPSKSLLEQIKANNITCEDIIASTPPDETKITKQTFYLLKTGIKNTPISLSGTYRIAFLVIIPETIVPSSIKTYWFSPASQLTTQTQQSIYDPIIIPFKIPDIGTNKPLDLDDYEDVLQTVSYTVNTAEDRNKAIQKRYENYENIKNHKNEIFPCIGYSFCYAQTSVQEKFKKVIFDIINNSTSCENKDFYYEPNKNRIFSTFSLNDQQNKPGFATKQDLNINSTKDFLWNLEISDLNPISADNPINVYFYIVSPLGEELKISQTALFSYLSEEIQKTIEENRKSLAMDKIGEQKHMPEYYPINNAYFTSETTTGITPPLALMLTLHIPGKPYFLYPGAKIGVAIQGAYLSSLSPNLDSYKKIAKCQTLEDLFFGTCSDTLINDAIGPMPGIPPLPSLNPPGGGQEPPGILPPPPGGGVWNNITRGDYSCTPIRCADPGPCIDGTHVCCSPCDVNYIAKRIRDMASLSGITLSEDEIQRRATNMSILCNAESAGIPSNVNISCINPQGGTTDYSIGLFQINLLAHRCPGSTAPSCQTPAQCQDDNNCPTTAHCLSGLFNYYTLSNGKTKCCIPMASSLDEVYKCQNYYMDADNNLNYALQLSNLGSRYTPWSTAIKCSAQLR